MTKLKNTNIFLKTNIFNTYKRLNILSDSVELDCNTPDAKLARK